MRLTFCGLAFALVAAAALSSAPVATAQEPARARTSLAIAGANNFAQYCVACHGKDAKGTGPLAATLKPKPADLTGLTARNGGSYPRDMVFQVIEGSKKVQGHGGRDMPEWGAAFKASSGGGDAEAVARQIDSLVDYLETIQVK
ncbi:MAG: cytochrome c [Vicinamibacterales bacterium]